MPYKSERQRRFFHAAEERGEIPKKTVEHWDKASKGKDLPEHVNKKKEASVEKVAMDVMSEAYLDELQKLLGGKR